MPDRWVSRLSAVRSAVSRALAGPSTVISTSPAAHPLAVLDPAVRYGSRPAGRTPPPRPPDRRPRRPRGPPRRAVATLLGRDRGQARHVAGLLQVLRQRPVDHRVDLGRVQPGGGELLRPVRFGMRVTVRRVGHLQALLGQGHVQVALPFVVVAVGEVLAPVRATGLLPGRRRAGEHGGDGEQVRRLPRLGARGHLNGRPAGVAQRLGRGRERGVTAQHARPGAHVGLDPPRTRGSTSPVGA